MKDMNPAGRASIAEIIASVVFVILLAGSLTLTSNAVAENPDNTSFANVEECKAFYQELKEAEINKLNQRKMMMGVGMPDAIYGRKKSKIGAEYESNLGNCESVISARAN